MDDAMTQPRRRCRSIRSRRRQSGFGTVEELLIIGAMMGCFVYPMSQAARSTGQQIAAQMESAHQTLLTQR
jgi:flagellar biosynthesis protein FliR